MYVSPWRLIAAERRYRSWLSPLQSRCGYPANVLRTPGRSHYSNTHNRNMTVSLGVTMDATRERVHSERTYLLTRGCEGRGGLLATQLLHDIHMAWNIG